MNKSYHEKRQSEDEIKNEIFQYFKTAFLILKDLGVDVYDPEAF